MHPHPEVICIHSCMLFNCPLFYYESMHLIPLSKPILVGYIDSDIAGDVESRRSSSRYMITIGGRAVAWQSKLQKCYFIYYRGWVHCHYQSVQGDVLDEKVLTRAWVHSKEVCAILW